MKKKNQAISILLGVFALMILFFCIYSHSLIVSANITAENLETAQQKLENLPQTPEDVAATSSSYLAKWQKAIAESKAWQTVLAILNPVLRVFSGYEFSLSLEFLVAIVISLVILIFWTNGIDMFYDNLLMSFAIGFLMTVITSAAGLTKAIAPKIILIIDVLWKKVTFFIIALLIIAIIQSFNIYYKKQAKEKALENLPKTEKEIKGAAESLKAVMKGMEDVKKGYDSSK